MTDIKEWSGVAELRIMMRCSMSIMKCRMFFGALWVNIVLISKVVCDFAQDEINREVNLNYRRNQSNLQICCILM